MKKYKAYTHGSIPLKDLVTSPPGTTGIYFVAGQRDKGYFSRNATSYLRRGGKITQRSHYVVDTERGGLDVLGQLVFVTVIEPTPPPKKKPGRPRKIKPTGETNEVTSKSARSNAQVTHDETSQD